jgi:uncharacterized protein YecE (DUF72 family)
MAARHAALHVVNRTSQLMLFGEADQPVEPDPVVAEREQCAPIAARLPATVHFGTSSWNFPGWRGIVYSRGGSTTSLSRSGLREYVQHPLLRTVGIDRSYYAPIPDADLRQYADQLPEGFRCCAKAPSAVTSDDPALLSVDRFSADVLEPFARSFAAYAGPFILQFAPGVARATGSPQAFADRLDAFLDALPRDFEYAVELRDRTLFTSEYKQAIACHGVAHVYNYWSHVALPAEQASWLAPDEGPFAVVRLLMRPGASYEQQREAFRPFNRLVEPDDAMREQVAEIARRVVNRGRRVYVLVNNKAEGSAPLTIRAIAERLATALEAKGR